MHFIFPNSVNRSPKFDTWIDMYSSDDIEEKVTTYRAMVEAACEAADEATRKEMQACFNMCCKLEHMFWDQALNLMKWPDLGDR